MPSPALRCALVLIPILFAGMLPGSGRAGDPLTGNRAVPFRDPAGWKGSEDGGHAARLTSDPEHGGDSSPGLRVQYSDSAPHWGNSEHAAAVPAEATALEMRVFKTSGATQAAMHIWLFQKGGGAWLGAVTDAGRIFGEWTPGWHTITIPVNAFRFEPRGGTERRMPDTDKMLLGCNYGDLDATIADISWKVASTIKGIPPPRASSITLSPGTGPAVAIASAEGPANPGAADPKDIARTLAAAGYRTALLRAGDLADPGILDAHRFRLLVLPNSPYFPAGARSALLAYLKAGGALLTMGGYAFDHPMAWNGAAWAPVETAITAAEAGKAVGGAHINTRYGEPADTLGLAPDQIGMFDPSHPLQRAVRAAAAPGQFILPSALRLEGPFEGYAAIAMTGNNSPVFPDTWARWIPLLNSADSSGRPRGPLGALLRHTGGPFKRGAWAFFGVTNRNLFAAGSPLLEKLPALVGRMLEPPGLTSLSTNWAGYHAAEAMKITAGLGTAPALAQLLIDGVPSGSARETRGLDTITFHAPMPAGRDVASITVRLSAGGKTIDEMTIGAAGLDALAPAGGALIRMSGSYFDIGGTFDLLSHKVNDYQTPRFLSGTNQTGMVWHSASENPLVWDHDFRAMRDSGLSLLRLVHFSPFASAMPGGPGATIPADLARTPPEKLVRQTDAIVRLARRYGLIIVLTLHDWMDMALSDADLESQARWASFWANHYALEGNVLYDIQNEPDITVGTEPDVQREFTKFLTKKYGSIEALRAAWRRTPPVGPLDTIKPGGGTIEWDDVRTLDMNLFKVEILNRWTAANVRGLERGSRGAAATVGFLPSMPPADRVLGTRNLQFSNMHWYGSLAELPRQLKLIDRRFEGKPMSIGEFGAQEAHDARTSGADGTRDEASATRFLTTGHYVLGLGGAFMMNWDWKDFNDAIFPWGLGFAHDEVAKPVRNAYRNMNLMFHLLQPQYEHPALYLLLPDSHRLGAAFDTVHTAIFNSVSALVGSGVPFGIISETDLARLPVYARAMVYPVPYCPSDETFGMLQEWVRHGGKLLFSGDIAYDQNRNRTRASRFAELGLPTTPERNPLSLRSSTPAGTIRGTAGKGEVWFCPADLELGAETHIREVYGRFLDAARIEPVAVRPLGPDIHAFSIADARAERTYIAINTGLETRQVTIGGPGDAVSLSLRAGESGCVIRAKDGGILAVEGSGDISAGGKLLARAAQHVIVISLGGVDIRFADAAAVMPSGPGAITLHTIADSRKAAQRGSIVDGQWMPLPGTLNFTRAGGDAALMVDPEQVNDIFLVGEQSGFAWAGAAVAQLR